MSNDLVNGCFELIGSLFIFNHCYTLYKDKVVKGVSILSTFYFFAWGIWNLFFYPSLNQWWSFYGGLAIMAANSLWIGMMVYYKYKNFDIWSWQKPDWPEKLIKWFK